MDQCRMRFTILSIAIAASAIALPPATAQRPTGSGTTRAADPQSIRIGRTTVERPFGGELVDRLTLVGSYPLGGRRVHLVRGDATGRCASRFVFVTEVSGGAPQVSAPFGTCSGQARVSPARGRLIVAMPVAGTRGGARFAFDGTTVRALDGIDAVAVGPVCPSAYHVDPATQTATIATLEEDYPLAYRSRSALKRVAIDPLEMRSVVTTLACIAPWPGAERSVTKLATPLFESRVHGPAAFAALDDLAKDPTSDAHLRASVRAFAAEMMYRLGKRKQDFAAG